MPRQPQTPAALVVLAVLAAPVLGQVATPPSSPIQRTPPSTPEQPRPQQQQRTTRPQAPNVDFNPITPRDIEGNIVPLSAPAEYIALAHNPLIDLRAMVRIAPGLYERRLRAERLVIDHVDLLLDIEDGFIEQTRVADEASLRESAGRLMVFTDNPTLSPSLASDLQRAGRLNPDAAALTEKILVQHQETLTRDAMTSPVNDDGATPLDQMMHRVLRLSISEFEYYFRGLMLETADYFPSVLPTLELDEAAMTRVGPLAAQLANESEIEARASLIRDIFTHLSTDQRRAAMQAAAAMRPEIDASTLMAPIPAGATPVKLDDETRRELMFQLLDGGRVETGSFLE